MNGRFQRFRHGRGVAGGRGAPELAAPRRGRDWTTSALLPLLARDHEVIAFDRPGAGLSGWPGPAGVRLTGQARLMRIALHKIGIERPIVVGHGYGGAVGLAWALDAPDRIAGLVTLAAPTHSWRAGAGFICGLLANAVTGPLLAQTPLCRLTAARGDTARAFSPQSPPRGYIAAMGEDLLRRPSAMRSNAAQIEALPAQLRILASRYAALQPPLEIPHGEADAILPAARHATPLAEKAPRSRLTLLPGVGHMLHHAAPEAVAAAVARVRAA